MRWLAALAALLCAPSAYGQAVVIGSNVFLRGEAAFPSDGTCLAADGCPGGPFLLDANFQPVSREHALIGHELGLVAIDLDANDEIRLDFDLPILNLGGGELYLAQAKFLTTLGDPTGPGINDVALRPAGVATWCTISLTQFVLDSSAGTPTVYYSDPEIKSDAYQLFYARADLSGCGVSSGGAVDWIDVRGTGGGSSKLDLAVVGNLNPPLNAPLGAREALLVVLLVALRWADLRRGSPPRLNPRACDPADDGRAASSHASAARRPGGG
jgi:hypothetical protein